MPTIRQSPEDFVTTCTADQYATRTMQGIVCKKPTDNWASEVTTDSHCSSSGSTREFLKITPTGLQCVDFSNKQSTYTTYCADCCGLGEFAVITTLGLRCVGGWCAVDANCNAYTPACDTTINRCVECNKDSHCTETDEYCNSVNKCEVCVWDTDYSCNEERNKRVKHCRLSDGTIKNTQSITCPSSQICKHAQCVVPENCKISTPSWTHHSRTCTGSLPATLHGREVTITDTTEPDTGEATYHCFDGSWEKQHSGCGSACLATTQSWMEGSNACSASVTKKLAGQTITARDTTGTEQGTATYVCDGLSWVKKEGSCNKVCSAKSVSWTEGSNTCSGSLPTKPTESIITVRDTAGDVQGIATHRCVDGGWSSPYGTTCNRTCASETKSGCKLSDTTHGSTSGSCFSGYSGSCDYSCDDGSWSRNYNNCRSGGPSSYGPGSYSSSPSSYDSSPYSYSPGSYSSSPGSYSGSGEDRIGCYDWKEISCGGGKYECTCPTGNCCSKPSYCVSSCSSSGPSSYSSRVTCSCSSNNYCTHSHYIWGLSVSPAGWATCPIISHTHPNDTYTCPGCSDSWHSWDCNHSSHTDVSGC